MPVFFRSSKNTYRRMIEGKGTKEVYHSVKAIMAAYAGLFEVYEVNEGRYTSKYPVAI